MSWKPEYALLIIFSTLVDYIVGIKIEKSVTKLKKRIFLAISLITNIGTLVFFKYFNFFSNTIQETSSIFGLSLDPIILKIILPIGISFYTFQALTYSIDVYRGEIKAEKHLGIFATYIIYFPQLVAGPIERAKHLIPQFHTEHPFKYKNVTDGLKLMLWGFFKKIVIADRLAIIVNTVYNNPTTHTGTSLILATFFFAFQIYCDFSGYSDIAIGAAKIMGFDLMDNFKRPYSSKSISEFWKRWHISLSSWFRDYVYIPLGGNRISIPRTYFNLFIVFLISGFWHGANWTFIIWGALHGVYMILEKITEPIIEKVTKKDNFTKFSKIFNVARMIITFILVCIGWVFFRANNVSDAFYILTNLFQGINLNLSAMNLGVNWRELLIAFGSIAFMTFVHFIQKHEGIRHFLEKKPLIIRWIIYIVIILGILLFGIFGQNKFIYFQF